MYAGLLLALPFLLYQAYAFVLPAFSPRESEVAVPLLMMVPFLFIAGVVFAYFVVLPPAISFLQNFNDDSFDILLQARDFYSFELLVLWRWGRCSRSRSGSWRPRALGIVTPRQLRKGRRYAIVLIAVLAMLLPGPGSGDDADPDGPADRALRGLYPLASLLDRRAARAARDEEAEAAAADEEHSPTGPGRLTMLFDLRGRGRRRTVKVVYITLAAAHGRRSGALRHRRRRRDAGRPGRRDHRQLRRRHRRRALREEGEGRAAQPPTPAAGPAAWAELARARVQIAGIGDNFDPSTGELHRGRQGEARAGRRRLGQVPRARPQEPRRPRGAA